MLGKIRRLDLLDVGGCEVVIQDAVYLEVAGGPGPLPGCDPSAPGMRRDGDVPVPSEVVRHALDTGESMPLALSLDSGGDDVEVVLDEKGGRRAARSLGLPSVGKAGLPVRAEHEGRVARVVPLLDQLELARMYLGGDLRDAILKAADSTPDQRPNLRVR